MANDNVLDEKGRPLESPRPVARGQRKAESSDYREKYSSGLDVELRADMEPNLVDDNIARLGFDLDRIKYDFPEGAMNAQYNPNIDTVRIGPDYGSSKDVLEHEVRHRGFQLLKDMYMEDPAWFEDEYGYDAAVVLLQLESEEQTELRDNPDASFNTSRVGPDGKVIKKTMEHTLSTLDPELLRNFINTGAYLSDDSPNAGIFNRGFTNLDRAAQDMLTKAGEPPRAERREPESDGFWSGLKKAVGFAEGGLTMDDQMETVFKSSRAEVDPVSGNEVPLGARPEEVRDDIPANLSEGEYVVPADVLRYYGVKFFEELRMQAKQGWQELDEGGRVGGEPSGMEMGEDELPFDISELQTIDDSQMGEQPEMNMGGYIKGYAEGGPVQAEYANSDLNALRDSNMFSSQTPSGSGGIEMREYVGPDGAIMYVQFMNGLPLSFIPDGFSPKGTATEAVANSVSEKADTGGGNRNRDPSNAMPEKEAINWATADADAFNNYLDSSQSKMGKLVKGGIGLMGGPVVGLALKGMENLQYNSVMDGLTSQLENPELSREKREELLGIKARMEAEPEKGMAGKLKDTIVEKSGIYGGESSMTKNLKDTSKNNKVGFEDTWLGDTLGFDGKAGNQGASLKDSLSGARRDKDTTPSPTAPKHDTAASAQASAKKAADKLGKDLAKGGK